MTTYDNSPVTVETTLTPRHAGTPAISRSKAAAVRAKAAATAAKTKDQATVAVRRHPVPAAAGVLAAVGATIGTVIWRRRAARTKAGRGRWTPGFFKR